MIHTVKRNKSFENFEISKNFYIQFICNLLYNENEINVYHSFFHSPNQKIKKEPKKTSHKKKYEDQSTKKNKRREKGEKKDKREKRKTTPSQKWEQLNFFV